MKKFIIILFLFLTSPCFGEQIQGGVEFNWVKINQHQRNSLIEEYKNIIMEEDTRIQFVEDKVSNKVKDPKSFETYGKIKSGIKEDSQKYMAAFFFHDLLFAYGIVEKTNLKNTYYYDVMGNLRYVDFLAKDYGDYPYAANQFDKKGKLIAKIYNVSKYDQFMYSPEGKFIGRWYEDKMYNRKGRVISTRSDY